MQKRARYIINTPHIITKIEIRKKTQIARSSRKGFCMALLHLLGDTQSSFVFFRNSIIVIPGLFTKKIELLKTVHVFPLKTLFEVRAEAAFTKLDGA